MARVPVTEAPNVITENIDLANSEGETRTRSRCLDEIEMKRLDLLLLRIHGLFTGIVRLLRQCDAQIFSGWEQYEVRGLRGRMACAFLHPVLRSQSTTNSPSTAYVILRPT